MRRTLAGPAMICLDELEVFLAQLEQLLAAHRDHAGLMSKGLGLTETQFLALMTIQRTQPVRMTRLAAELGLKPAAASYMVDRLAEHGLVARETVPEDRRAVVVSLSEAARHRLAVLEAESLARVRRAFEAMPGATRRQLTGGFAALMEAWKADHASRDGQKQAHP